jgi:hypothetical protein
VVPLKGVLRVYANALSEGLKQHGYKVVGTVSNAIDLISYEDRLRVKQICIASWVGAGSLVYQGRKTSDICLQVAVVDPQRDGLALLPIDQNARFFHVWTRSEHSGSMTWDGVHSSLAPQFVDNLMRMPSFRTALEGKPSACSSAHVSSPLPASLLSENARVASSDSNAKRLLAGTWSNTVTRVVTTKLRLPFIKPVTETRTTTQTWTFCTNGIFQVRVQESNVLYTAEGLWAIRDGNLFVGSTDACVPTVILGEKSLYWVSRDEIASQTPPQDVMNTEEGRVEIPGLGFVWQRKFFYDDRDTLRLVFEVAGQGHKVEKRFTTTPLRRLARAQ